MTPERKIQTEILKTFGNLPWLRIWRNNTGVAQAGPRMIRFGLPGQADISGLMLPSGRRVEIEIKTATGRQSDDQKRFQAMIERFGGLYILARSVNDVHQALNEARSDESPDE